MNIEMKDYLIAIVLFSTIMVGTSVFYLNLSENNGLSPDDLSSTNKISSITTRMINVYNSLKNTKITGIALIDRPLTLFATAFNLIFLVAIDIIDIYRVIFDLAGTYLNIPAWFIVSITTIILINIIFRIINIIFNRET